MDSLKKEILYKAKHRGSKELDFLIGNFAEMVVDSLTAEELQQLVKLLYEDDLYIFQLLQEPPTEFASILRRFQNFLNFKILPPGSPLSRG